MAESASGKPVLYAPLCEGDMDTVSLDHQALITGLNPSTGEKLEQDAYLRLLRSSREGAPELAQNIARSAAAALMASKAKAAHRDARLVSLDGRSQSFCDRDVSSGEVVRSIWKGVVPGEIMSGLPDPEIMNVSACTAGEVRELQLRLENGKAGAINMFTHNYRRDRVTQFVDENAGNGLSMTRVVTPDRALLEAGVSASSQPYERFIADLVKAGSPSAGEVRLSKVANFFYGPFHGVSRLGNFLTGGKFDLENFLSGGLTEAEVLAAEAEAKAAAEAGEAN